MKAGVSMKKMMQKLTAAMLTLACVPVTGMTAQALAHPAATWDAFENLHLVKDDGYTQLYVSGGVNGNGTVYYVTPRMNEIFFSLRENLDRDTTADMVAEVLDVYFPGFKDAKKNENYYELKQDGYMVQLFHEGNDESRLYGVCVGYQYLETDGKAEELESGLLLELAKRALISEFYGFGETAQYGTGPLSNDILQDCFPYYQVDADKDDPDALHSGEQYWKEIPTDWDAVRAYLAEHYPDYTVEQYEKYNASSGKTYTRYRINGIENLTLYEKVDLAEELRVKFHVTNGYSYGLDPVSPSSATGHNALEQPGDTNLDCEVDILDVIAANKHILGIGTLDKTGLKNADMDGNGTADTADSLAILKKALE